MITLQFGRYLATPQVSILDHKNIFKKAIDHEIPVIDCEKAHDEANIWLKDHFGFVKMLINKETIFEQDNYKEFVKEMHSHGIEVKVFK